MRAGGDWKMSVAEGGEQLSREGVAGKEGPEPCTQMCACGPVTPTSGGCGSSGPSRDGWLQK